MMETKSFFAYRSLLSKFFVAKGLNDVEDGGCMMVTASQSRYGTMVSSSIRAIWHNGLHSDGINDNEC